MINKVKAALKARQGPAEKDQSSVPIADAIAHYWDEDMITFAIPAHDMVKFDEAAGWISAELVTPCPPGIPAVAPGELYTEENVSYLEQFVEIGGFVAGAADPALQRVRVVAH